MSVSLILIDRAYATIRNPIRTSEKENAPEKNNDLVVCVF